jgi:GMP synthase-like glutamine amidotransferase
MVRALIIEHDPLSTPERVGSFLEAGGWDLDHFVVVHDLDDPEIVRGFPDENGHDLVVLMGAPWSVYDPRCQGWVKPELDFLRMHMDRGTPVLGICFGAQAMSAALGSAVTPSAKPEYGWSDVESTTPEIATGPWFQFHHDSFTLPAGATPLASNESGLQAFTRGRALGVQFHPEMSSALLASWCAVGGATELVDAGIDPDRLVEESRARSEESQPALERMLDWFLEDIAG